MLLKELAEKFKHDVDYIYEKLKLDISEDLKRLMEQKGITKKELARRMGVSPAYVTKIFSAENISLKTIAKILSALEADSYTIKLVPENKKPLLDELDKWYYAANNFYESLEAEEVKDESEEIGIAA
ncbi:helix-turn-helix domain-containing protein [Aquifex sp.]